MTRLCVTIRHGRLSAGTFRCEFFAPEQYLNIRPMHKPLNAFEVSMTAKVCMHK